MRHDTTLGALGRTLTGLLVGLATASGCGAAPPETDPQRLERIDQMYAAYRLAFPHVPGIRALQLRAQLRAGARPVLVDVRPRIERQIATLPGAITREQLEADEARYRDQQIVTFCTIGARSGRYAATLRRRGFDVRNLEGSLLAWTHAGGPLVDGAGQPTRRVHVYGRRWSLTADGYEPVITHPDGTLEPL